MALFSENGTRWLVADQGIMMVGGARHSCAGAYALADNLQPMVTHAALVPWCRDRARVSSGFVLELCMCVSPRHCVCLLSATNVQTLIMSCAVLGSGNRESLA